MLSSWPDRCGSNERRLRDVALGYAETYEEFPWGERVIKVRKKVFVFLGTEQTPGLTVKLEDSHGQALTAPGAAPTGYGLGKSGWVTCRLDAATEADPDLLLGWLDESWRAVAPKKLAAAQEGGR